MDMYISLRQLEIVVDLVGGLDSLSRPEQFPELVLPALASLLGCDVATYNEIGPQGVSYRDFPSGSLALETRQVFAQFVAEHPLVNYYKDPHHVDPVKVSDFLDTGHFHRLDLYEYFFRPIPVEHQMAITVEAPGPTVVGIALNRSQHDFTETDRAILAVLQRPLAKSFACLVRAAERNRDYAPSPGRTLALLTDAEFDVLSRVAAGETNAAIARRTGCSPRTVAKHLEHTYRKLQVQDRSQAAAKFAADSEALNHLELLSGQHSSGAEH
ncbi:DNA-binding CsgD family transcriptional regulator [Arthrobacter silviterrae]|uniref:Helix-turn-helix transcriptional regulator n=1 Tax=Arthrobacter silviterrae TaxID=2026658 RepID=A0ABX0D6P8_9MICC|nr:MULTISPECIES: helix-turn-helix transcriptional regulator [Arthrobacter]MCU6480903.1 helix-turn-helix transcriptional regulator [Arthrobacter sp. A2-55]MDQ0276084.1 DNA-binding CsgD family transcriptional regulator [Arthrobacter silviterrae]NGN82549.1 helix-turn-helix transcriptional regulator [Arthrobacter silviterrae]